MIPDDVANVKPRQKNYASLFRLLCVALSLLAVAILVPSADAAPPRISYAGTADFDADGRLDNYTVQFNEPMNPGGVNASDFHIGGTPATGVTVLNAYTWLIHKQEGTQADTGDIPELTYAGTSVYDAGGERLGTIGPDDVEERDVAPPRIFRMLSHDMDEDGIQETVEVRFSEDIKDEPLLDVHPSDWPFSALDKPVDVLDVSTKDPVATSTDEDDETIYLTINGTEAMGTARVLELGFYNATKVMDAVGNIAASQSYFLENSVIIEDVAPPRLHELRADLFSDRLVLVTSEPVWGRGQAGAIRSVDVDYQNLALGGAANIEDAELESRGVTFFLDAPLAKSDMGRDRLVIEDDALRDGAGNSLAGMDVAIRDVTPPDAVEDLVLLSLGRTTAELAWTAPRQADLHSYELRYSTQPIDEETFEDAQLLEDEQDPGNPRRGAVDANLTGLEPDTKYFFAVRYSDQSGNLAPISNALNGTTLHIPGAPLDKPVISSDTHRRGSTSMVRKATFSWEPVSNRDELWYHIALIKDKTHKVDADDPRVSNTNATFADLGEGTWAFHVRARTAAGFGPQATYAFTIDLPSPKQLTEANRDILVWVTSEGGNNTIDWSLGAMPEKDASGFFRAVGVQIWHVGPNGPELVADIEEGSPAFRNGQYVHMAPAGTRYFVTVYFAKDVLAGYGTEGVGGIQGVDFEALESVTGAPDRGGIPWWVYAGGAVVAAAIAGILMMRRARAGRMQGDVPGDGSHTSEQPGDHQPEDPEIPSDRPRRRRSG